MAPLKDLTGVFHLPTYSTRVFWVAGCGSGVRKVVSSSACPHPGGLTQGALPPAVPIVFRDCRWLCAQAPCTAECAVGGDGTTSRLMGGVSLSAAARVAA